MMKKGNYIFKVNKRNTRTRCGIRLKLIKTPERHHWSHPGVFIVNFEPVNAGWDIAKVKIIGF